MLAKKTHKENVPIGKLKILKEVQMRVAMSRSAIVDYAEAYQAGVHMPPLIVFWQFGGEYIVADGFHRLLAARKVGLKTLPCVVKHGGKREARLYAAGCNASHGVRRTVEDKRKAVLAFLGDKEWKEWADTVIAKHCAVSDRMVATYRKMLGEGAASRLGTNGQQQRSFIDRHGNVRVTSVAPREYPEMEPVLAGERCPYCNQKMPGKAHKIR